MNARRVALVVGLAGLVALLAVAALTLVRPAPRDDVASIAAELRCPTCQALSVADSSSATARQMREQIGDMLAAGRTRNEVKQHFVDRYGEWILLAPSSPLPWLVPPAIVTMGGIGLVVWLMRRPRPEAGDARHAPASVPTASAAYRDRIREEVEALDA